MFGLEFGNAYRCSKQKLSEVERLMERAKSGGGTRCGGPSSARARRPPAASCGHSSAQASPGLSGRCVKAGGSDASVGGLMPVVEPFPQRLSVLAEPSVGEARAGAANMSPGAHPQLEVAPRLVGPAPGQIAVLASQFHHPYAAGPGLSSLQLLQPIHY
jgi:hypothetical protein